MKKSKTVQSEDVQRKAVRELTLTQESFEAEWDHVFIEFVMHCMC